MTNKIALITGGSRGIGKAIAISLAKEGINIGLIYRQRADEANNALKELQNLGVRAFAYQCDVRNLQEIDNAFQQCINDLGGIDILVNNAGVTQKKPFLEMDVESWEDVMNTNLRSAFYLSQQCARIMKQKKWGRIINIGSIGGERLISGVSAHYAASKAGLSGLTRIMAKELGRYNILANCLSPGLIETELSDYMNSIELKEFKKIHPLKRMGTVQEVANMVAFLASEKSSYITGETIIVCGGLI